MFLHTALIASAFNLVCSVAIDSVDANAPLTFGTQAKRWPMTYRIDLAASRWCVGPCDEVHSLETTESKLLLKEVPRGVEHPQKIDVLTINRRTGALQGFDGEGDAEGNWIGTRIVMTGECQRAPFSGFPERKF